MSQMCTSSSRDHGFYNYDYAP